MKFDILYESKMQALFKEGEAPVVVIVPGSFKPPHRGHYEMVERYSQMFPDGHVHVLISEPSPTAKVDQQRYIGDPVNNKIITAKAAKQIFDIYVQHLNNVIIDISPHPSPMTAAFEALYDLPANTQVVLGASKKDGDWKRWNTAQEWIDDEELPIDLINPEWTAVEPSVGPGGRPFSASNIRSNFDNPELIKGDLPLHVVNSSHPDFNPRSYQEIVNILGSL